MWLVDVLVQPWVVLQPVHPIDASVCKYEEEGHREEGVGKTFIGDVVVKHRMASNFRQEPRQGEEGQRRESLEGVFDFKLDLIRQEAGVILHVMVKEEVVGEPCEAKIKEEDADIGDCKERDRLPVKWKEM